jgi:hypothetical protein
MPTQKNSASWDLQLGFNLAFKRLRGSGLVCVNLIMRVSCPTWEASYIATTLFRLQYDRHAEILMIQLWCIWCYDQLIQFWKLQCHGMPLTLKLQLKIDRFNAMPHLQRVKVYYNLISAPSLVIRILNPLHMAVLDPGQHLTRSPYCHPGFRSTELPLSLSMPWKHIGQ